MPLSVTIEGLEELRAAWSAAVDRTRDGLREASLTAAAEGVREAQGNHPYTDRTYHLTGDSHADQTDDGEAEMVWPVLYASYVDRGTSRSRPYPYTPQAEDVAALVLGREAERVLDTILGRL